MSASVILLQGSSSSSSAVIFLEGELRKAYEDFVLGKDSLSEEQIEKLKTVTNLPAFFISDNFDARFKKITAVDLNMFVSVVEIGDYFLYGCSALTSVDLSALTSLSIIGSYFLYNCSALTSVTLPSSSKITKIEEYFLADCESLTAINNMQALSNVISIDRCFLQGCTSLETVDFRPLSNVKWVDMYFLYHCPKLTKKEHLDQVDLTLLLHLSDNDIEVHPVYEDNNNLKVALARVRAGGANGLKYFIAKLKQDLQLASQDTVDFLVKQQINDDQIFLRLEADHLASVPLGDRMKLLDEIKRRKAGTTENRRDRFEFETDQFDVSFDLPVFSPTYNPVHSARDAYAKVLGAIVGGSGNNKTQMTFTEVDSMLSFAKAKTDSLLQTVGKKYGQSENEVFAIVAYSADVSRVNPALGNEHNFYYRVNNALGLRESSGFTNHSPLLDLFVHLVSGLKKIPAAKKNITVYRAVSKSLSELSKKGAYEKVGTSICYPAFTSTSFDPKVSLGFVVNAKRCAALMKITVSQAYPIIEYSQFPGEQELLLLPNSRVKIDAVRSAVPRTDSEITSLGFKGALPNTIDVVEMSQQERSSSQMSNFPTSPTSPQQQKPILKMDEDELCAFLKTHAVNPKILEVLKQEVVTGLEFMEAEFITENESLFSAIRKTAVDGFKKLHAALCSSSSSSGGTGSSAATAASQ